MTMAGLHRDVGLLPWRPNSNVLDWKWQEADRIAAPAWMLKRRERVQL
jgi:hypothetical protein